MSTDKPIKCAACQEREAIEDCEVCGNAFCEDCIYEHEHCTECRGTGVNKWNVKRNSAGELDYLHGKLTGEIASEACRRCEGTGLSV